MQLDVLLNSLICFLSWMKEFSTAELLCCVYHAANSGRRLSILFYEVKYNEKPEATNKCDVILVNVLFFLPNKINAVSLVGNMSCLYLQHN